MPTRALDAVVAVMVAAVVGAAIAFGDGSGDGGVLPLGVLCIALVVLGLALASCGAFVIPRLDGWGATAVASALGLALWVGLTIAWSLAPDRSWLALNKALLYVAALLLGVLLAGATRETCRAVAAGLMVALSIALLWALAGKAIPSLFPDGGREARLRDPVGYWNALALLADAIIPLGLWVGTAWLRRSARAAGAAVVYLGTLALLLTLSRAGVVAGAAVIALWVALSRRRIEGLLVVALGGLPAVVVAGWAFTRSALVDNGVPYADRVDDGRVFGLLALLGIGGAAIAAALAPLERLVVQRRREVIRVLAVAAGVVLVVGVVALVAAVGNPVRWAGDQLGGEGSSIEQGPGRLTEAGANNRLQWWGEAIDVFRAHPAIGSGSGTFQVARTPFRDDATPVGEPHSVPLQLLAGGGIVAGLLLVAFLIATTLAARGTLLMLPSHEREAAAALSTLPVVYGIHALVDYDLDLVAVSVPAFLVVGVLLAAGRLRIALNGWLVPAVAAVAGCAVLLSIAAPWAADRAVARSLDLTEQGKLAAAKAQANRARAWNPLSLAAVNQRAFVAARAGDYPGAARWYEKATRMQPQNAETWLALGLFLYDLYNVRGLETACASYTALNRAYTLDPNGTQWTTGGPLDVVRDAVNNGACEPA